MPYQLAPQASKDVQKYCRNAKALEGGPDRQPGQLQSHSGQRSFRLALPERQLSLQRGLVDSSLAAIMKEHCGSMSTMSIYITYTCKVCCLISKADTLEDSSRT